jgi:quercetin dioxygenase-like cupin family protein
MKSNLKNIARREFLPGFHGKMIHTDRMTLAYWDIKADSSLPKHHHHHEQVVNMLEGEFEITLNGIPHHLYPGDILPIPSNVPHSGRAITDCKILDVFTPAREDYQ